MQTKIPTILFLILSQYLHAQTNLDTLFNYPKQGEICTLNGDLSARAKKQEMNRLKNRYQIPTKYDTITFSDFIKLPLNPNNQPPELDNPQHKRAVVLTAYIKEIKTGGKGESCNCGAKQAKFLDAHIELVPDFQSLQDSTGTNTIIAETTERGRILASQRNEDWRISTLRRKYKGKKVRIYGWIYYDYDHHIEDFITDPTNTKGIKNWRATCWEIHPIIRIEPAP
jgi:hypothetical protein